MTTAEGQVTEEQFMQWPEDGYKHELVDGEVVSVPTSGEHDEVISRLNFLLYPLLTGKGYLSCGQTGFRMASGNIRVPDLSFMSRERLPGGKASKGFADGAPDLCVEVLSPSERRGDILRKVGEFFESGARVVWLIDADARTVIEYLSDRLESRTYAGGDELALDVITPGFRLPTADLFATI